MSMHRLMALSMSADPCRLLRGGVGGERRRLPPGRHLPPRFRPASSSRRRGTHARRSSRSVPVTEAGRRRPRSRAASMSLVRRTCGAGSSASRPRIAPRRAGRWRRWRRPGRGWLRVRRSSRAGDPRPHVAVRVDGPGRARRWCGRWPSESGRSVPRAANPGRPGMEATRANEATVRARGGVRRAGDVRRKRPVTTAAAARSDRRRLPRDVARWGNPVVTGRKSGLCGQSRQGLC